MINQLVLDFGEFQITNKNIYSEAFELTESLCSQTELRFGCCEASKISFKCRNVFGNLVGKTFIPSINMGNETITFGKYKVQQSTPSGDKMYTNVVAYDLMYDILNADVSSWYENLVFPMQIKRFRDLFFEYLGISQVYAELINDNVEIDKTIQTNAIPGKDIITAICEINGVFGRINREGNFEYVSLSNRIQNATYPSLYLYPGNAIYPQDNIYDTDKTNKIARNGYKKCSYEDFETSNITKVQIRQESGDIGAIADLKDFGDDRPYESNAYIVENNFLTYGMDSEVMREMAITLLQKIHLIKYRPFSCETVGNPKIELGSHIRINSKTRNIDSYILKRTLKGIQGLSDSFSADGTFVYQEKINSVNREIKRLMGKTNVLERTVEETKSLITDEEKGLQTQIIQTAEKVESKVSKGDVSTSISQEAELIDIKGNRIRIWADNFKLDETGLAEILNANIIGTFQSGYGEYRELIKMQNGHIYPYGTTGGSIAKIGFTELGDYTEHFGIQISKQNSSGMMFVVADNEYTSGDIAYRLLSQLYDSVPVHKFYGDFEVYNGTKSRVASTKSYDDRALYCYEMPSPMFGDIGHGVIGEDGLCYVDIDLVFGETVDTVQNYQVFLQSYSEHNVYVYEKTKDYFVVKGEPNTEFDWELKAKQLDFPIARLEQPEQELDYKETNYIESAEAYLNEYEMEVLGYE